MTNLLEPLPYHREICAFLKAQHEDVWNWFSSAEAQSDFSEAVQLELLKSTYRMNRLDHEELYILADEVEGALGLDVPVTLYQSQDTGGPGQAALYYTPGHGHVVFGGPILSLLSNDEKRALLGHELAHFKLWTLEEGDYLIADRILMQTSGDHRAEPSHFHSARLNRLYTEIYADRGSLLVCDSAEVGISTLLKAVMGTEDVSPASYLEQADEIFSKSQGDIRSDGYTHPENFIRARAMKLWSEAKSDDLNSIEKEIKRMIEGSWMLDEMDLIRQNRLTALTREVVRHFLKPEWVQTGRIVAHAKLYFPDFKPGENSDFDSAEDIAQVFDHTDEKLRHFLTHLLLDFGVVDRDLDENGMAQAFDIAENFTLGDELEAAARKELKMLKRDIAAIRKDLPERLVKAASDFKKLSTQEKAEITD